MDAIRILLPMIVVDITTPIYGIFYFTVPKHLDKGYSYIDGRRDVT